MRKHLPGKKLETLKLRLHRETVRRLTNTQLQKVGGAGVVPCPEPPVHETPCFTRWYPHTCC